MPYQEVFAQFWEQVKESVEEGTFAKLTMAKTIGKPDLKNIFVRPMAAEYGNKVLLKFSYRPREMQDVEKVLTLDEALEELTPYLVKAFSSVLLFTTANDLVFKVNKKGMGTITENPPTFSNVTFFEKEVE
tara:strand:- start:46680 stop:47072 length:393 start_codon:yes stop_codon:yes gene_type:complete